MPTITLTVQEIHMLRLECDRIIRDAVRQLEWLTSTNYAPVAQEIIAAHLETMADIRDTLVAIERGSK